jgi:hypothetical protein
MPPRHAFAMLVASAIALTTIDGARAQSSRVAIVRPRRATPAITEATVRLAAEIRDAGFEAVILDARPGVAAREQVEQIALDPKPFATIGIVTTDRGAVADVWVADHLSEKTSVRRVDTARAGSQSEEARTLAIRSVELLRASLLEIERPREGPKVKLPEDVARWMHKDDPAPPSSASAAASVASAPPPSATALPPVATAPPPPPPATTPMPTFVPPPTRPVTIRVPPRERSRPLRDFAKGISAELLPLALIPTGGIPASFLPTVRVATGIRGPWLARVSLGGNILGVQINAAAGSATIREELAIADIALAPVNRTGVWVPVFSLGVGALHLRAEGRAVPPFESRVADAWAFAAEAGVGLAVHLVDPLALVGEARAAIVAPRPVVQIGNEEAANTGFALIRVGGGLWLSL